MVEVLEKRKHEANCDKCGSKLTYTYEDVHYNRPLTQHYIVCPVCQNEEIDVPDPEYPDDTD